MATWAKIKLFWQTMLGSTGSTLTATTTAAGDYDVDYLYNMLAGNMWKASTAADPHYISYDAGVGNAYSADYIAASGHNWGTIGGYVLLEYSDDGTTYTPTIVLRPTTNNNLAEESRIIVNGDFEVWAAGAATAPTSFVIHGFAGGTVARETVIVNREFSMKLTRAGADGGYKHVFLSNALTQVKGTTVAFGGYVYCATSNTARLTVSGTQLGQVNSAFHSGSGAWEWLTMTVSVPSNETLLEIICDMATNNVSAYFDVLRAKVGSSVTGDDSTDMITAPASKRYWRLRFTGHTAAPEMAICIWGNKTELDYASSSFDPYEQEAQATVNRSYGGAIAGIHTKYIDRRLAFTIDDADSILYAKVKDWWDTHGMKQLFIAWETANNPTDVWLMYPDSQFRNPLNLGGAYRTISLSFKGAV